MKIRVLKFDPSADAAPYYVEGEIEGRESMSALEALVEFNRTCQPVSFDYNCNSAWCGRCAMMINGKPALVCTEPVALDGEYTFEPLQGFPVIRDLVVDKTAFHDQITEISKRVHVEPYTAETVVPDEFDPSTIAPVLGLENCCRCGVCTAACPVHAERPLDFVGPAAMTAIAYRHLEQLDKADRVMEAVSNGLFRCIQCGQCDAVCAQSDNINHLALWQTLRDAADARGLRPSYAK